MALWLTAFFGVHLLISILLLSSRLNNAIVEWYISIN